MASWWDTLFNTDYDVPTDYGSSTISPRTVTSTSTPNLETLYKRGYTPEPTTTKQYGVPDYVRQAYDFVKTATGQNTPTKSTPSTSDYINLAAMGIGGVGSLLAPGLFMGEPPVSGYQGSIPNYRATRSRVANTFDPNRRPGSGGQRYFSDVQFTPEGEGVADAQALTDEQAMGLAALNKANPASFPVKTMNKGGIATAAKKESMYLDGATDGMADEIPAMIDGEQPAMLSDGEFVIPADVVSHLGNGNSDAGAKVLEEMMDEVRVARTGTKEQAPEIDPEDFLPT